MAKEYNKLSKEELLQLVEKQDAELELKKYGLVWDREREPEKVVLDCENNAPILERILKKEIRTDTSDDNILIEGDNYHALTVLNYTHKGKIDVIYIDPPYNTGNKDFVYNDKYIDKEDIWRHSKWLNFMEKRLLLAEKLLKETGVIFISIDDNEQAQLKMLCDKIFGEQNFIGQITVVGNPRGRDYGGIARMHDYIFAYSKTPNTELNNLNDPDKIFPFEDDRSGFEIRELRNRNIAFHVGNRPNLHYPFYVNQKSIDKNGFYEISLEKQRGWFEVFPKESQGFKTVWRWGKPRSLEYLNKEIVAKKMMDGGFQIVEKYREKSRMARSVWWDKDDNTEKGTLEVKNLLGSKVFGFPKPVEMIRKIIEMGSTTESIVLDFFTGSGTTGHAVMQMNKEDGGNRKFVLCTNNENKICEEVTYPRIQKVIKGYKTPKGEKIVGLGGNLQYFKTALIPVERIDNVSDEQRREITEKAGQMIAMKENTFEEVETNDWYQIFENKDKSRKTAIYFREATDKFPELLKKIQKEDVVLYVFSYGRIDKKLFAHLPKNITVDDVPEPILEIYKEINLTLKDK